MGNIKILYWNIENVGLGKTVSDGKYTLTGPEIIKCISKVIQDTSASIVGLNEIRSGLGDRLGTDVSLSLTSTTATWKHWPSPQFVDGRLEQYVFLWNEKKVKTYKGFQYDFPNPSPPPTLLGFPLQKASERPPCLGFFETTDSKKKKIAVAAFHGPAPGYWLGVKNGNRALGLVSAFKTEGDTCIVMGDTNVQYNADASVMNSPGWYAFSPLISLGFVQMIPQPMLTSLKHYISAFPAMTIQDAYNQPYDQMFMRTAAGFTSSYAGREELLLECEDGRYLSNVVKDMEGKWTGSRPLNYDTVEKAFIGFRKYVSDHMPVLADIDYT